jgi:hypothetical protein
MKDEKVWCVKHKHGWCTIKGNYEPNMSSFNIPTECEHFIVIPLGIKHRKPNCRMCQNG